MPNRDMFENCFLISTFLVCPMKSTMTATIMPELRTFDGQTGTVFLSAFLISFFFFFFFVLVLGIIKQIIGPGFSSIRRNQFFL